jgi:hypothetical protein
VTFGGPGALSLVMRIGLLAAILLLTAGCGAYHFGGGASGTGTVSGHVLLVPCAPVESSSKPCAGRPASGLEISFSKGNSLQSAVTDSGGAYSIELAPGTWKVEVQSFMRIVSGPATVTVSAGGSVTADYTIDSGIRAPAPQQ